MTDLEICKRIAEIEGECIEHIHGDVLFVSRTEDVFNHYKTRLYVLI